LATSKNSHPNASDTSHLTWIDFLKTIFAVDKVRTAKHLHAKFSLEQLAKCVSAISAVCFAIGLLCTSFYFASVSLRPFEPVSVQQIFLGGLYLVLTGLTLLVPARLGVRSVIGWLIQLAAAILLIFDKQFLNQLAYLMGHNGTHIPNSHFSLIVFDKGEGLFFFLAASIAFHSLSAHLKVKQGITTLSVLVRLSISVLVSLLAFSTAVYPRIPLALGGGDFPVMRIEFDKDTPYVITSRFDISNNDPKYQGHKYYARLLHSEKDVLYLTSLFWYNNTVVEVPSKHIIVAEYGDYNPTTYILPD
jgi:hypothetical protein